jgi:ubiquitin-conjugating enzyme E2 A
MNNIGAPAAIAGDGLVRQEQQGAENPEALQQLQESLEHASAYSNSADARKRLMRDFRQINENPRDGITASPEEDDIFHWTAIIFGADDTPWEGGIFKLDLKFGNDYPMSPPRVKFITPMFHPNVYRDGNICMDIMKNQWSPTYDVAALLLSIQSLLSDPNPLSAANAEAAELLTRSRAEYEARVKQIVLRSIELADDELPD